MKELDKRGVFNEWNTGMKLIDRAMYTFNYNFLVVKGVMLDESEPAIQRGKKVDELTALKVRARASSKKVDLWSRDTAQRLLVHITPSPVL